jgi:hypothetical protein
MPFIPIDQTHLTVALQNDLQQWRTTIQWAEARYLAYNQQLTPTVMTALGVSPADQAAITAFVNDLGRFIQLAHGTLPVNATDMKTNLQNVLGVM